MIAVVGVALAAVFAIVTLTRQRRTPAQLFEEIIDTVTKHHIFTGKMLDWNERKINLVGRVATTNDAVAVAKEVVASLNDPFTRIIGPLDREKAGRDAPEFINLGVTVAAAYADAAEACDEDSVRSGLSCEYPTITSVGHDSPAERAELRAGDIICGIDGQSTKGMTRRQAQDRLRGLMGTSVTLEVERDGSKRTVKLVRTSVNRVTAMAKMLDGDIGYLRIAHFQTWAGPAAAEQAAKIASAKAVVVDVRNNPGGDFYCGVQATSLFIKEGIVARTETRLPGPVESPLFATAVLRLKDGLLYEEYPDGDDRDVPGKRLWPGGLRVADCLFGGKPTVVLVNENTASAAESFAGALRDTGGATIIGARTFGKGVGQLSFNLPELVHVIVTAFKTLQPKGFWAGDAGQDRRGMMPDITPPTQHKLFDFGSDQDEHLQAAAALLRSKLR